MQWRNTSTRWAFVASFTLGDSINCLWHVCPRIVDGKFRLLR